MELGKTVRLVVGLGNPDPEYKNTYHNVGHHFADYLESFEKKGNIKISKSDAYMNASGAFVAKMLKQSNCGPEGLLIVHDDSDLLVGEYKISFNRGSGGHKGVQNIIDTLKTKEFWRLRIGVRPESATGPDRIKAEFFVLKPIASAHKKIIEETFDRAARAIGEILRA